MNPKTPEFITQTADAVFAALAAREDRNFWDWQQLARRAFEAAEQFALVAQKREQPQSSEQSSAANQGTYVSTASPSSVGLDPDEFS